MKLGVEAFQAAGEAARGRAVPAISASGEGAIRPVSGAPLRPGFAPVEREEAPFTVPGSEPVGLAWDGGAGHALGEGDRLIRRVRKPVLGQRGRARLRGRVFF